MASRGKNARKRGGCLLSKGDKRAHLEYDAEGWRPRTDEEGEVWRSADAAPASSRYE